MLDAVTTKPGDKYRSLKRPDIYEALRRQGYSKQRAARISNAMARRQRKKAFDLGRSHLVGEHGPELFIPQLGGVIHKANYSAQAGQVIAGRLVRGSDGKFTSSGAAPAKTPPSKLHVVPTDRPKKPAKGRGRRAARGRKPAKTDQQREQERLAKRQQRETERAAERQQRETERAAEREAADKKKRQERDRILSEAGLDQQTRDALVDARAGDVLAPINGEKLAAMGLAERAADGSYRLTSAGRETVNAALAGDAGRVRDTTSGARDRQAQRQQRQTEAEQRRAQAEARRQQRGGGGSKKPKEPKPARRPTRQAPSSTPLRTVGGSGGGDRGATPKPAQPKPEPKPDKPQISEDLVRAAQAVLTGRVTENQITQLIRAGLARRNRDGSVSLTARGLTATQKSFFVLKDSRGQHRWVALSSNAYRDRDGEIVSTKALEQDCARADRDGAYGPLRWWHVGAPVGKGWDLGQCDFNAMHGRVLVESGTFHTPAIGAAVAKAAPNLQLSIGFIHGPDQPDGQGVFHHIRRFERSLVPIGRAANPFTRLIVKELTMDKEKETALKGMLGDEVAQQVLNGAETVQKDADAKGVAYKADADLWQAVVVALKAAMAPAAPVAEPEPETIVEKAEAVEAEAEAKAPPMMEEAVAIEEEPLDDPEQPTLSAGDFKALDALITAKIAPLAGLLDMEKKMTGHVQQLLGQYQQTKDAADAERVQEIATLKASIEQAQQRLAALEGDVPNAFQAAITGNYYRASQNPATIVTKEEAEALGAPQKDQQDPFADIMQGLFGNQSPNGH